MKVLESLENGSTVVNSIDLQANPLGLGIFHPAYGASDY